jgi:hypothetical protein
MPFTFSHPAIILPLSKSKKKLFSLTGLVVGSMVPDFEFLFRLRETACFAHTWLGIVIFDIPMAVVLSFVFHLLVRNILILQLPQSIRQRFTECLSFNWKKYFRRNTILFFLSVFIGIGSHIFLDAFTHKDGWFVLMDSFFIKQINIFQFQLPLYTFLQLFTSLLGAVYIAWFIFKMPKGYDVRVSVNAVWYWILLVVVWVVLFILRIKVYPMYTTSDDLIIAAVGCFVYALLLISVYYNRRIKKALR